MIQIWEKDISLEMRRKATQTVESIDPDKIAEGSKATTVGILIDKARLIDGEQDLTASFQQICADKVQIIQVLQQRGVKFPESMVD